ncbi:hypothetical protein [Ornithinibacillus halophilus]|uniref:Uncharacterized protein n=1 Tax=Ornithinibacillus halophilus TaxID=930117 RepID=A0A1M5F5G8_9BACI|nr:hypothetical protein [Ornithinibacillus halophilus]SHF86332.1 hypothetical protein SAMN05216225_100747 [Ornithinibacillus halophilus]
MNEKKRFKNQLDHELQNIHFNKQEEVLDKAYPTTWKQKLSKLWNKEIDIPLLPVGAVFVLMLFGYGYKDIFNNDRMYEDKELVEIAGNTYWKDELEKVMGKYED